MLDVRTLVVAAAIFLILAAATLVQMYRMHRRMPGPRDWALGMTILSMACPLLVLRDVGVPTIVSVALANPMLIIGGLFMVIGNLRFTGRPVPMRLIVVLGVLGSLPFVVLAPYPDLLWVRAGLNAMILGGLALWGILALRTLPGQGRQSFVFMLLATFLLGTGALSIAARLIWLLTMDDVTRNDLWGGTITAVFYAWAVLLLFTAGTGLPVLVTGRLRQHLEERIKEIEAARTLAESALAQQRNFLAMVSHEIRTPLGIMSASADVIGCNLPESDAESREEVERIRRASGRLSELVETCLAYEWLESASAVRYRDLVNLPVLVKGLAEEYQVQADWQVPEDGTGDGGEWDGMIVADPTLLPVALSCLINNARKYGRTREGVVVRVLREGGLLCIDVEDDGPGVSPQERSRIFEKYYRSPQTLRKSGAGLGLYLSRRIAEMNGGTLSVQSRTGGGSCFRLTLPLDRAL